MGMQPGTKQRPKAFQGVDVYFMETIPILIAGILTGHMVDGFVLKAPAGHRIINVVLIGIDHASRLNGFGNDRLDSDMLDIGQHLDDHLASAL